MKIERLYAITIYLLNHGRTSAKELSKHFEVSLRTIQRDMDSLCLAGIPVISIAGAAGGYEISNQFQLNQEFATPEDYFNQCGRLHILTSPFLFKTSCTNVSPFIPQHNLIIILPFLT